MLATAEAVCGAEEARGVQQMLGLLVKGAAAVATVVVPTIGVLGVRYVNRSWNVRVIRAQHEQLAAFAKESVLDSSQRFNNVDDRATRNQQKLDTAVKTLMKAADNAGIKLDWQMSRTKVESAVSIVKREREAASKGTARK